LDWFLSGNARSENVRLHLGEAAIDKQLRPRHVSSHHRCDTKHYCLAISSAFRACRAVYTFEIIFNRCCPVSEDPGSSLHARSIGGNWLTAFTRMRRLRRSVAHVRRMSARAALVAL